MAHDIGSETWAAAQKDLLNCINENGSKHQTFLRKLRQYAKSVDLASLVTLTGTSLLHECIIKKRKEFLIHFVHVGVFIELYNKSVADENPQWPGRSPTDLAIAVLAKAERDELERLLKIAKDIKNDELRMACLAGNAEMVKELLQNNRCNLKRNQEWSTLYCAVVSQEIAVVKLILDKLSKSNMETSQAPCWDHELGYIVDHGAHELLPLLCRSRNLTLSSVVHNEKKLIDITAVNGDKKMFKLLREQGAPSTPTILSLAAANGQKDFIEFLLNTYPSDVSINAHDNRMKTPLHFAAERDQVETVQMLLLRGADVMVKDKRQRSPLHTAADAGAQGALKVLIQHSKIIDKLDDLVNAKDRYLGSELCFLVRGKDQDQSAWHYVLADRGLLKIFRERTKGGAVDVADYGTVLKSGWGQSPGAEIVEEVEGFFDMANIKADAAPDMTPLHSAILKGNTECALQLLQHLTDLDVADSFGHTPLHLACTMGNSAVIRELRRRGVKTTVTDKRKRTPAELQKLNGHMDIISQMGESDSIIQEVQEFVQEYIRPLQDKLSAVQLQERGGDQDLKSYLKDTLRDLQFHINTFLYDKCGAAEVTSPSDS